MIGIERKEREAALVDQIQAACCCSTFGRVPSPCSCARVITEYAQAGPVYRAMDLSIQGPPEHIQ